MLQGRIEPRFADLVGVTEGPPAPVHFTDLGMVLTHWRNFRRCANVPVIRKFFSGDQNKQQCSQRGFSFPIASENEVAFIKRDSVVRGDPHLPCAKADQHIAAILLDVEARERIRAGLDLDLILTLTEISNGIVAV